MKLQLLLLLFLFSACGKKQEIAKEMIELQSKVIVIPQESQLTIQGKDTVLIDFIEDGRLKLLAYIDSAGCSSCAINKMYMWNSLIEYSKVHEGNLKFYFIFSPRKQDVKGVRIGLAKNAFDYPVLLDTLGSFEKLNPHLPKNKALHTFLLDENNNVILVGNPLHNKKIEEMFYKIVEEKLGKPQKRSIEDSAN